VPLKLLGQAQELLIDGRVGALQFGNGHGRADSGDHILTLCIGQELTKEAVLARIRVACKGHAASRILAHVAKHHGADVDGCAPRIRNVIQTPIGDGVGPIPGAEHGLDGLAQLVPYVIREIVANLGLVDLLELDDDLLEHVDGQIRIALAFRLGLVLVQHLFELAAVDALDDAPVHGDEAPVRIIGKAIVIGLGSEALEGLRVEAHIEDGIHHAGHGYPGTGAHRDEQRVPGIAELLAGLLLEDGHSLFDLIPHALRESFAGIKIGQACFRRAGETRRHRQTRVGHLRQASTLAAKQISHVFVALRGQKHPLFHH